MLQLPVPASELLTSIGALLVITLLLTAHEGAHAFVGWRRGYAIKTFGLGFGPGLVVKVRRDQSCIQIRVGLIFLGAYVEFAHDSGAEHDPWVIAAGPLGSVAMGILLGLAAIPFAQNVHDQKFALLAPILGFLLSTPLGIPVLAIATGGDGFGLSGPIGAVGEISTSISKGPYTLLTVAGLFSASIGGLNLIPLPPLDGGRLLLVLLRRRFKISEKVETVTLMIGVCILVLFLALSSAQDIARMT